MKIISEGNHQPEISIYLARNVNSYLEKHPDSKEAFENQVMLLMESGKFPGNLSDILPDKTKAYYVFLSTGDMLCYQVTCEDEKLRDYVISYLISVDEIEVRKAKHLLTKTLTSTNKVLGSITETVKTHQGILLLFTAITAVVRFFTSL